MDGFGAGGGVVDDAAPGSLRPDEVDGWADFLGREFPPGDRLTIWDVLAGDVEPSAEVVRVLDAFDPSGLDAGSRAQYVTAWERVSAWVEARRYAATVALVGPVPSAVSRPVWGPVRAESPSAVRSDDEVLAGLAADEVFTEAELVEETRLAIGCTESYAKHRMWLGRTLAERLPVTLDYLRRGRIGSYHVAIITELSARLTVAECAVLEARVFPRGETQSGAAFRRTVRKVVAVLRPRDLEEAFAAAVARETGVSAWVEPSGLGVMQLRGDPLTTQEVRLGVYAEARAAARTAKANGEPFVPIGARCAAVLLRWSRASTKQLEGLGFAPVDPAHPDHARVDEADAAAAFSDAVRHLIPPPDRSWRRPRGPGGSRAPRPSSLHPTNLQPTNPTCAPDDVHVTACGAARGSDTVDLAAGAAEDLLDVVGSTAFDGPGDADPLERASADLFASSEPVDPGFRVPQDAVTRRRTRARAFTEAAAGDPAGHAPRLTRLPVEGSGDPPGAPPEESEAERAWEAGVRAGRIPRPRLGFLNPLHLPSGVPPNLQLNVIMTWDQISGQAKGPAILEGFGPIPLSLAKEMAADARWRRVLLEEADGHLLDYGRRTYRPTAKLRDHLVGLDQTCRAYACSAKSREADHGLPWWKHGRTSAFNMNGLCRHSHRLKTMADLPVINHPDGSLTWISPAGNHYTNPPEDLRINDYGLAPEQPSHENDTGPPDTG